VPEITLRIPWHPPCSYIDIMLLRSAVVLAVLTAVPALAAAQNRGAYAGLGVGGGSRLTGDWAQSFDTDGHMSGRIFGGYRFGPWGVEANYFGSGMTRKADDVAYTTGAYGITGKYHITFDYGIELYVRLGLDRTALHTSKRPDGFPRALEGASGMGIEYGTGVTWQSHPLGTARLRPRVGGFLDFSVHRIGISSDSREFAGSFKNIQLGVISSIDF
jgi:hypothetical protein